MPALFFIARHIRRGFTFGLLIGSPILAAIIIRDLL